MTHPLFDKGRVAVITGAARGIGRSAALNFARRGMQLVLADVLTDELAAVAAEAEATGAPAALAVPTDVGDFAAVTKLRDRAFERFGVVNVLMNNAAIGISGGAFTGYENWQKLMAVNLWGVINGVHAFVPKMLETGADGLVINTGSKQGITCPPGNAAYNASKAAVKVVTEQLAHELRERPGCRLAAHLLIPGWTFTGINTIDPGAQKPSGAWYPDEVIGFMLDALDKGDFYILCPDNETPRRLDEKRMAWAIGDIIHDRPALSRWHPDFRDEYAKFVKE
jgi:NAD(P)-dependent dehydrogenase (short-subunit alcohol dehydrogenase family)